MNILHLRESLRSSKGLEGLLHVELVLGSDRDFFVATRTVMTRGRGCDRAWLRLRDFVSRPKFVVSRKDFMEMCSDKVFLCRGRGWRGPTSLVLRLGNFCVMTKFGQGQWFLCRDRVWPWAGSLCRDRVFSGRDKVWPGQVFSCCDRVGNDGEGLCCDIVNLCRDRVWPKGEVWCGDWEFYVAT